MGKRDAVARVLVLSNHRILRCAVESSLAQEFDVVRHVDSQEAFRNLGQLAPDVILMDVDHMDMMDGHSTAKWLHNSHPGVGAIFMMDVSPDSDSDRTLSTLVSGGSFTLDCMQGALQGVNNAIREMAAGEPEYLMFGYRLKVHSETRELAQTA